MPKLKTMHIAAILLPPVALAVPATAEPAKVRAVPVNESAFGDGTASPDEIARRQVQNLNRQTEQRLADTAACNAAAKQAYDAALAKSQAEQQAYEQAMAQHRANMAAWQQAVEASQNSKKRR